MQLIVWPDDIHQLPAENTSQRSWTSLTKALALAWVIAFRVESLWTIRGINTVFISQIIARQ